MDEPSVAVTVPRMLLEAIVASGLDRDEVCRASGFDLAALDDPDARLPRDVMRGLWAEAYQRLGDPHLGLHLGERLTPRAANVVTYLAMSSRTLREGIGRFVRYQRILGTSSRLALEPRGDDAFFRIAFADPDFREAPALVEYSVVTQLRFCRWITGSQFDYQQVFFRHDAPADASEHERILRCPIHFASAHNGMLIAAADLDRPSVHADPSLAEAHQEFADQMLAELDQASMVRRVKGSLLPVLEEGPLDLGATARRLAVSRRTLQRRLAAEGTNYREVLDALRRELTLHQLGRGAAPIDEIAYLTGFSDVSTFYRAFKRWTGKTPVEWRSGTRTH